MAFGPRVQLITLVMMALVISSALALFPEQAGKYDWFKNNIGFVNTAAIDDSRVYVSSKEGGIAALDAKDGSVVWRVVLDEGEQVQTLEVARDIALTLSSTSHVRAFSSEGRQLWEAALQDGDGCSGRAAAVAGVFSGKGIAIIACGETLQAKQMASGKRLWSVKLPAGNAKAVALHLHGETGKGTVAMLDAS